MLSVSLLSICVFRNKSEYYCRPNVKIFLDIIECLRGSIPSTPPRDAMGKIVERFLKNISSWALTTKVFVILHRCL